MIPQNNWGPPPGGPKIHEHPPRNGCVIIITIIIVAWFVIGIIGALYLLITGAL